MQRRDFIKNTAVGAATLAGSSIIATSASAEAKKKTETRCKITVLKKEHYKDIYQQYRGKTGEPCPYLDVGQEFVVDSKWNCPEGFCHWAWADVRTYIHQVAYGRPHAVGCCTEGCRPVVFKFESIELEKKS